MIHKRNKGSFLLFIALTYCALGSPKFDIVGKVFFEIFEAEVGHKLFSFLSKITDCFLVSKYLFSKSIVSKKNSLPFERLFIIYSFFTSNLIQCKFTTCGQFYVFSNNGCWHSTYSKVCSFDSSCNLQAHQFLSLTVSSCS